MDAITRSAWIEQRLDDFLKEAKKTTVIELYDSEIKRCRKHYPNLIFERCNLLNTDSDDKRYRCIVKKGIL